MTRTPNLCFAELDAGNDHMTAVRTDYPPFCGMSDTKTEDTTLSTKLMEDEQLEAMLLRRYGF